MGKVAHLNSSFIATWEKCQNAPYCEAASNSDGANNWIGSFYRALSEIYVIANMAISKNNPFMKSVLDSVNKLPKSIPWLLAGGFCLLGTFLYCVNVGEFIARSENYPYVKPILSPDWATEEIKLVFHLGLAISIACIIVGFCSPMIKIPILQKLINVAKFVLSNLVLAFSCIIIVVLLCPQKTISLRLAIGGYLAALVAGFAVKYLPR